MIKIEILVKEKEDCLTLEAQAKGKNYTDKEEKVTKDIMKFIDNLSI